MSARAVRADRKAAEQLTLSVGRLRAEGLTFAEIADLTGLSLPDTRHQVKQAQVLSGRTARAGR